MLKQILTKSFNYIGLEVKQKDFKYGLQYTKNKIRKRQEAIIKKISGDFVVLNGPFKGLKYPSLDITEGALLPRIVGSYETSLHPLIYKILGEPYTDIIDVGCADGYFAVGFASKMPGATVHCFDINEKDLRFCQSMAQANNVSNLTYNKWCSPETLINFNFRGRGLIFCDCEGYELDLFTPEVIQTLTNVDVLIELHDLFNPVISGKILERFQATHRFEIINNLNVDYSGLEGLDALTGEEKTFALAEHKGGYYRNSFMEWVFLTPR